MAYPTSPKPIKIYGKNIEFKTIIAQFENGSEQRSQQWPTGKISFALQYDVLTQAEMQTLWDYYVSQQGSYGQFDFFDFVSNQTYTVRFADDKITMEQFMGKI